MFKRLIIAVLIGLLAYPPFVFAGGVFDSKAFPGLEPETYASCFFYWDQGDARMHGDGSAQIDGSGLGNHTEQGTAGKQPVQYATYLAFDGTDDYMRQAVIASYTGLTSTNSRCSFATGQSWLAWASINFAPFATETGEYEVIATDSGGKRAKGYLKAVGGGEAWGDTVVINGTMEADSDWPNTGTPEVNERSDVQAHGDTYSRHINDSIASDRGGITQTIASGLLGKQLKLESYVYVVSGTVRIRLYRGATGQELSNDVSTTGSWQKTSAQGVGLYDNYNVEALNPSASVAAEFYSDDITLSTMTDCVATGVHVTTTPGGATEEWATMETGFKPYYITGIEIRKSAFSMTGDLTILVVVKPDDGQPAADEVILGKMDETNSFMGYGITLNTAGKLVVTASNDGAVNDNFIADAAVFADGAQTQYKLIGFSYDASESNIDVFVNGSEVASTEAGDVSTAIYNTCCAFDVGRAADGNYFNGDIAVILVFNDVLTAAEHQQVYHSLKRRFGL